MVIYVSVPTLPRISFLTCGFGNPLKKAPEEASPIPDFVRMGSGTRGGTPRSLAGDPPPKCYGAASLRDETGSSQFAVSGAARSSKTPHRGITTEGSRMPGAFS